MHTSLEPAQQPLLTTDSRVVLYGLVVAALTSAGNFFQKLNGVRGGSAYISGWLILACVCFFPTFIIANKVFLMGGRLSVFVPATATTYVLTLALSRVAFGEPIAWGKWLGCALILAGVAVIARQ